VLSAKTALRYWAKHDVIGPVDDPGLINETWVVGNPGHAILQWVNPIFSAEINTDIAAITAHLRQRGMATPTLLLTPDGQTSVPDPDGGCWRLMTFIEGTSLQRVTNPAIAAAAGHLAGRFHRCLSDCDYQFIARPRDVHNTPERMRELQASLTTHQGHPLSDSVDAVAQEVLKRWTCWRERWGPVGSLTQHICHGDLKISNLRFNAESTQGVCLLDLDTVGWQSYSVEMGDAWRSWCNSAGEDDASQTVFRVDLFEASAKAWLSQAPQISIEEREMLVPGIERICLELSARFCRDAIENNYFRENRDRWPVPGQHNLTRGQAQLRLANSVREQMTQCVALIE